MTYKKIQQATHDWYVGKVDPGSLIEQELIAEGFLELHLTARGEAVLFSYEKESS